MCRTHLDVGVKRRQQNEPQDIFKDDGKNMKKKNISAIQRVVLLCAQDAASKLCFESIAIVDLIHREHRFLATHAFNYAHTIFDSDSTSVIDRKCVVPSRNPNDSRKTFHRNVMLFFV